MLALAGLLLQNTYGGWFWIIAVADQLNLVFIDDSNTGFCSEFLRKHELKPQKQPLELFKKVFSEILQMSQESNCVEGSF